MSTLTTRPIDYNDVQGLVRFAYKHQTEAAYLVLRIDNVAMARRWLATAPIASAAVADPPPASAIQVAFTAQGLRKLGLPEATLAQFSAEFLAGMSADPSRSRRLGDVGESAPAAWNWGYGDRVPDAVVMLFAIPGGLAGLIDSCTAAWGNAFTLLTTLDTSDLGGVEQFGFTDGISQPVLDWDQQLDAPSQGLEYRNVVALGEFVLGYKNEYGEFGARPLVAAVSDSGLLAAQDDPAKADLGLNGSYAVIRDLRQDVRGFWRFVAQAAPSAGITADQLAAAFVGRERNGDPLVPPASRSIAGIPGESAGDQNRFLYDGDPDGVRCPFGAHIRRANPRTADYAEKPANLLALLATALGFETHGLRDDLTSAVRFHRILRRGREYGPALAPAAATAPAPLDEPERGLRFVCINASIARQFEFVQNAWLENSKFNGMTGESDPLLGNREPLEVSGATDSFTMPRPGAPRRNVTSVPPFVTVRGGAYLFLPSLRALRYITKYTGDAR